MSVSEAANEKFRRSRAKVLIPVPKSVVSVHALGGRHLLAELKSNLFLGGPIDISFFLLIIH